MHPDRASLLSSARRVLVKVGSAVLTCPSGLDADRLADLAGQVASLRAGGRDVVVVSSGAIAAGVRRLGLPGRPTSIPGKQAAAAVGQGALQRAWEEALGAHGIRAAQVLLTADDLANRHRYLNARHTFQTLLEWGVVPVVNENDTVAVEEIKFGDNDQLAALVAGLVAADAVVILSDVDAMYDADPGSSPSARPIRVVRRIDAALLSVAGETREGAGGVGTGGMVTKLLAARKCMTAGIPMVLLSGREPDAIRRAVAGEPLGTLFAATRAPRHRGRRLWLAHLPRPAGELVVDQGAAEALRNGGRSLLPVGVRAVRGAFGVGAAVRCVDESGAPVGVGLVNYASAEIERIRGRRTADIDSLLGYRHSDEVIHRDHFVLEEST
ncbi:MAG: glutamate 5-kinase [Deltaproteobacteria bacterium]|nr:glutamate 5-kinase [Deltaproteobacteria bacterium]